MTEAADEALVMGVRLTEGIDVQAMARRFGFDAVVNASKVQRLAGSGHLTQDGHRIALTPTGRLLLDYILAEISLDQPTSAAESRPLASAVAA